VCPDDVYGPERTMALESRIYGETSLPPAGGGGGGGGSGPPPSVSPATRDSRREEALLRRDAAQLCPRFPAADVYYRPNGEGRERERERETRR